MSEDSRHIKIPISEELDVIIVDSGKSMNLHAIDNLVERIKSALKFGFDLIDLSKSSAKEKSYLKRAQKFVAEYKEKVQFGDAVPESIMDLINDLLNMKMPPTKVRVNSEKSKISYAVKQCIDGEYCGLLDDLSRRVIMFAWIVHMSYFTESQPSKEVIVLPKWLIYEWVIGYSLSESFSKVDYQKRI